MKALYVLYSHLNVLALGTSIMQVKYKQPIGWWEIPLELLLIVLFLLLTYLEGKPAPIQEDNKL